MEHSGNQAEPVVALLAALGSRAAEELAARISITGGPMAWRPVNVSSRPIECNCVSK